MLASINGTAQHKRLTLETIFGGSLYDPAPTELRWSPDGRRLAYFLPDEGDERALWVLDVPGGKKTQVLSPLEAREMAPSPEQASLSERDRTRRNRYDTPSYSWSPDGNRILLGGAGPLYVYDLNSSKAVPIAPLKSGASDPKFSPDGKWISFVYQHDLWIAPSSGGEERQLTSGGSSLVLHAEPDWVYEEEFNLRTAYQWAPDSSRIAFLELDETPVPAYPILEQLHLQATVDLQRYPKAGDPNPRVRAGVASLESGRTVWISRSAEYIPRIDWADAHAVVLQLLNRAQNEIELVEVNPETGNSSTILNERDANWVSVTGNLRFLSGGKFLWTSDRTGFRHIYLYERSGKLVRQITSGEWVVSEIEAVDENGGWIYYTSNQASTIGRDLFRIRIDGTGTERITKEAGTHNLTMNPQATADVDSFSSIARTQQIRVHDFASGKTEELFRARSLDEFDLAGAEMTTLKTPDGATVRLLVYKPRNLSPGRKCPALVYAYGMPGSPTIQDAWPGNRGLFHQFLVQQGFVVALIDDRSSSVPGHRYAVAAYHKIGSVAAKDHEFAVQYLKSLPYVKPDAIGIWGWSGGGFTATYDLTHTNLFKAGIAGAPVTDWRLYDSVYTERYMGLPVEDPEAYERSSSIAAAGDCKGRLLLIYGTQDDNVHPQNTIQLINALIRNKKQFDLMIYPDKTHSITGAAENIHLYTMIYQFLETYLK